MLFFQLLDMFSNYDLYGMTWFRYINWVSTFFIVAGFSTELMFEKYGVKRFYIKVLKRFIFFSCIGFFLTFWCEFEAKSLFVFDRDVVGSIGLNLILLSFLFLFTSKISNVFYNATWFSFCGLTMIILSHLVPLDVIFNPFITLFYMSIGASLAFLKDTKISVFANYIEKIPSAKVLAYFGKHSLFFYFFHFAIFRKLLLVLNSYKGFNVADGVVLTVSSILMLVIIEKFRSLFRPFSITRLMKKKEKKQKIILAPPLFRQTT